MRVSVIGTSGSGKTTFAARFAQALGAPRRPGRVNWRRAGEHHDPAEFVRCREVLVAADARVCCGNYSTVRPVILGRATHLIWTRIDGR